MGVLQTWLTANQVSNARLGGRLGVSRQVVWLWAQGRKRPSLLHAVALDRLTQGAVPVATWLTKGEQCKLDKLLGSDEDPR